MIDDVCLLTLTPISERMFRLISVIYGKEAVNDVFMKEMIYDQFSLIIGVRVHHLFIDQMHAYQCLVGAPTKTTHAYQL